MPSTTQTQKPGTTCCIVGGGPAGMMLGYLLARAGTHVTVLEKHADFNRDFRGDTIHPSTLELMYELKILEDFLKRPHQEIHHLTVYIDDLSTPVADFSHIPTHCKFVGIMPQWDFLNFIAEKGKAFPEFNLLMQHEAIDLMIENDQVVGVVAKTPTGPKAIRATLTIGADGRHSITRQRAGLQVHDLGAPIDVLWMRISRKPDDPDEIFGRFRAGTLLVMINRGDYWQCAFVIPKGGYPAIQQQGLPAFRQKLESVAPFIKGRTEELRDWKDISLLSVTVDRLIEWHRRGLLCIGDSAHAMSPVGGVGINLAIQDAVAAANILAPVFAAKHNVDVHLHELKDRREFPTRMTQNAQVFAHKRFITPALAHTKPITHLPFPLNLVSKFPFLRRLFARTVGLGVRPEHIKTPDVHAASQIPQQPPPTAAPDTTPFTTKSHHT